MYEAIPIPELDPADVALRNELFTCGREVCFELGDESLRLRFKPAAVTAGTRAARVMFGSVSAWFCMQDWDGFAHAQSLIADVDLNRLPPEVLAAVLEVLFEDPLDQLGNLLGGRCAITDVVPLDELAGLSQVCGLVLESNGGRTIAGSLFADQESLPLIRDLIARAPRAITQSFDELPIVATVEIGGIQLTLSELKSLRRHDVIMSETTLDPERCGGLLRVTPVAAWRVTIEDESLTLVEWVDTGSGVDAIPAEPTVLVRFELGQVRIPFGKLATLKPSMQLSCERTGKLAIQVGRQTLGHGELVRIGDRHGVRLLEWSTH